MEIEMLNIKSKPTDAELEYVMAQLIEIMIELKTLGIAIFTPCIVNNASVEASSVHIDSTMKIITNANNVRKIQNHKKEERNQKVHKVL